MHLPSASGPDLGEQPAASLFAASLRRRESAAAPEGTGTGTAHQAGGRDRLAGDCGTAEPEYRRTSEPERAHGQEPSISSVREARCFKPLRANRLFRTTATVPIVTPGVAQCNAARCSRERVEPC